MKETWESRPETHQISPAAVEIMYFRSWIKLLNKDRLSTTKTRHLQILKMNSKGNKMIIIKKKHANYKKV